MTPLVSTFDHPFTTGQIVILAMAFGSGAIGNGRSLRERKSLDKVELDHLFLFLHSNLL